MDGLARDGHRRRREPRSSRPPVQLVPDDVLENLLGETEKSALEDPEAPDVVPPSALKMKLKACPLSVLPVCTVPPGPITVPENNTADVQLVQISSGGEVTLTLTVNPDDFFYLRGNALMVKKGLDYEVSPEVFQASVKRWILIWNHRVGMAGKMGGLSLKNPLLDQHPGGGAVTSS